MNQLLCSLRCPTTAVAATTVVVVVAKVAIGTDGREIFTMREKIESLHCNCSPSRWGPQLHQQRCARSTAVAALGTGS